MKTILFGVPAIFNSNHCHRLQEALKKRFRFHLPGTPSIIDFNIEGRYIYIHLVEYGNHQDRISDFVNGFFAAIED